MVSWLSAQPAWVLIVVFLPAALVVGFVARLLAFALIPLGEREAACSIATALMTAFAATFALLIALTVSNEASILTSAQNTVSAEAAQASVLAWASTAPGVPSAPIQSALRNYLEATRAHEWHSSAAATGDDPATEQALSTLERKSGLRRPSAVFPHHRAMSFSPPSMRSAVTADNDSPQPPEGSPSSTP